MIDDLVILKCVLIDIFDPQTPLEIKTGWFNILVLEPASLDHCFAYIVITAFYYENFLSLLNSHTLPPLFHVCYLQKYFILIKISFYETLKCRIFIYWMSFFQHRRWFWTNKFCHSVILYFLSILFFLCRSLITVQQWSDRYCNRLLWFLSGWR